MQLWQKKTKNKCRVKKTKNICFGKKEQKKIIYILIFLNNLPVFDKKKNNLPVIWLLRKTLA